MVHPDVFATNSCPSRPRTLPVTIALFAVAIAAIPTSAMAARSPGPKKQTGTQNKPQTPADPRVGEAERKLLAGLEAAIAAHADHLDFSRLDRELADAFRADGLDLDKVDPKTAGARLAGHPETPGIAAAIDEWCRVRRTRLKLDSCADSPPSRGPPIPTRGGTNCATSSTGHSRIPRRRSRPWPQTLQRRKTARQ